MADIPSDLLPWASLLIAGLVCTVLMSINETLEALRNLLDQIGSYYEAKADVHTAEAERIQNATTREYMDKA